VASSPLLLLVPLFNFLEMILENEGLPLHSLRLALLPLLLRELGRWCLALLLLLLVDHGLRSLYLHQDLVAELDHLAHLWLSRAPSLPGPPLHKGALGRVLSLRKRVGEIVVLALTRLHTLGVGSCLSLNGLIDHLLQQYQILKLQIVGWRTVGRQLSRVHSARWQGSEGRGLQDS